MCEDTGHWDVFRHPLQMSTTMQLVFVLNLGLSYLTVFLPLSSAPWTVLVHIETQQGEKVTSSVNLVRGPGPASRQEMQVIISNTTNS